MRALVQRVARAEVRVEAEVVGRIASGLLILLGVGPGDGPAEAERLATKISKVRIFPDLKGRMNLDAGAVGGAMLVVSQFTLYADLGSGNRPGFSRTAPPQQAESLYRLFVARLEGLGFEVACGRFGTEMDVELVNRGPVTLWYDTDEL